MENVVDVAINGIKAAAKDSSIKRFIYTSSSFVATFLSLDKRLAITTKTFNNGAVRKANLPGPEGDVVYAASKVEAERRIMAWVKKNKPNLVVNMSTVPLHSSILNTLANKRSSPQREHWPNY